ncbi:MAG TPA: lipid II flippase MurJ, partial [Candidatus Polarisedimenticolaceae bacterium]|nr:lipid II flippase MurJ [Candidatus Polarisedimenticolaceae bacterium]
AALLALPATAGLVALREPIIQVIFEHGRFDHASTLNTSAALLCYALGLYAYAVTKIQVPTFYALGDTRVPVIASTSAVAAKLAANAVFVLSLPMIGVDPFLGLALSTSIAAWTNFGVLAWGLKRRAGSIAGHGVVRGTLGMALVALATGVACGGAHAGLVRLVPGGGTAGEVARLGVAVGVGLAAAAAGAIAMRIPEARAIARRVASMARRGRPA